MSSSYGNKLARALISTRGNLKSCKNIKVTFNPWILETKSVRDFYHYINSPSMRESNDKCSVQVDVRSDLCEPVIQVKFIDDSSALFKTKALTTFDIVREFDRLSRQKAPKEEVNDN